MKPATDPIARVLVVDDERPVAISLVAILEAAGYRAVSAFDGEEALFTAQQFRPDCVVSDVCMPGCSGIEMAMQVLKNLPNCRILLISGRASSNDLLRRAADVLHFELLEKPITPEDLLAHVAALLGNNAGTQGGAAKAS